MSYQTKRRQLCHNFKKPPLKGDLALCLPTSDTRTEHKITIINCDSPRELQQVASAQSGSKCLQTDKQNAERTTFIYLFINYSGSSIKHILAESAETCRKPWEILFSMSGCSLWAAGRKRVSECTFLCVVAEGLQVLMFLESFRGTLNPRCFQSQHPIAWEPYEALSKPHVEMQVLSLLRKK